MEILKHKENSAAGNDLLTFLKRTQDGRYSEIEQDSLNYSRIEVETDTQSNEEQFFYSIS